MIWNVLGTQQADDWNASLQSFPDSDIYFLPEYHRAYELNGDGVAKAFVAEGGTDRLVYPFMMRPISGLAPDSTNGAWYDIETVYGYSGPLCTTSDPSFLEEAWGLFSQWCEDKQIVAEFIRFNPFMDNHLNVTESYYVEMDRETVAIRLDLSAEELWAGYRKSHRTKVRRAISRGLVCREVPLHQGLNQFRDMYHETMERAGAGYFYYFSDAYFNHLSAGLPDQVKLFSVWDGDHVAASTLFLAHGDRIHAHLGGSGAQHQEHRPNNLLMHTVASWGQEHGFRWLHLGGGLTSDPEDSIFQFKASISRLRVPFYIGKRVHNQAAYDSLCSEWTKQSGVTAPRGYLLQYRLPIGAAN